MTSFRAARFVFLTLLFLVALSGVDLANAAAASVNPGLPPTKPSLLSPIAAQIDQLLNGGNAAASTTSGSNAAAATTTGGEAPPQQEEQVEPPGETFGTRALSFVLNFADLMAVQGAAFVENFADMPQASDWFDKQASDQRLVDRWTETGHDMIYIVAVAFGSAFLFEILLMPLRRNLRRRTPTNIFRRLSAIFGLLIVELLPVLLFVSLSLVLLDQNEPHKLPRFVVLNVVYAIALNRLVLILGGLLLASRAHGLRLLPLSQPQSAYLYRWFKFFSFVAVYGYFIVDVARSVHVPAGAINAFGDLLALILVIMTIAIIVQKRAYIAVHLRGSLSAAQRDLSPLQSLRLWLARCWHLLAIGYLVIGYLVTAFSAEGGFAILMRGTILSFFVFVLTGLVLHALNRRIFNTDVSKQQLHGVILRFFFYAVVWIVAAIAIATAWGADIAGILGTDIGYKFSLRFLTIVLSAIGLALVYSYVNSSIDRHLNRRDGEGAPIIVSARMRTLLPMMRTAIFIIFLIVGIMVILSEAGFDTGPLLAGAGVIGVAVGFGSQTLVKDFLTGLFIVIENTIAIGDVVRINAHAGVVEAMSVRTMRLRDSDGAVHILPYSEVTNLINQTKDFAYALFNTGVAYDSNLRRVMEVIKEVGEELRQDGRMRASILDPIEVLGVDSLGDSAIIIQSRIRTRPGRQWDVKRAFLLRLKERFDLEKITIPYPTVYQLTKADMPKLDAPKPDQPKPDVMPSAADAKSKG